MNALGPAQRRMPGCEPMTDPLHWQCALAVELLESADAEDDWRTVTVTAKASGALSIRGEWGLGRVAQPFWCLPGLFWGDNQQDTTPMLYPRFDASLEKPSKFRSPFWQFHVSRLSQPLVGCYDGRRWWILEGEPCAKSDRSGELLSLGLGFGYRDGNAWLSCSLPAVEEPYRPVGHDYTEPRVSHHQIVANERITWRYRQLQISGERVALLDHLQSCYHEWRQRQSLLPVAADAALVARATRNGLMRWHYAPQSHCFKYSVAYDRIGQQLAEGAGCTLDSTQMHVGWISGWVVFEPLLDYAARLNDPKALDAVVQVWEHLRQTIASPSGFWWGRYVAKPHMNDGKQLRSLFESRRKEPWDGGWLPDSNHIHLRTIGDAVLRAARALRNHGARLPFVSSLREDILRQARQMAEFAKSRAQLPLSVDAGTGEVQSLSGSAAMIWISVWLELLRQNLWHDRDVILRCAEAYRQAVGSGRLYGAPEDVGECASSEDAHIAINAYCNLYEQFRNHEDLETALRAARWLYLWRRCFHLPFSSRTMIGAYRLSSVGGEFASPKNNHFHVYGLDVDDSLRKLAQWTGDARWSELADDHWRFAAQLIALEDGQFNGYEGMMTEQFYFADWSCLGNSVHRLESDERRAAWDVGPHFRNHGNLAGFSTVWCVAFALGAAIRRFEGGSHESQWRTTVL